MSQHYLSTVRAEMDQTRYFIGLPRTAGGVSDAFAATCFGAFLVALTLCVLYAPITVTGLVLAGVAIRLALIAPALRRIARAAK